jgi:hypothetical protein
LVGGIQFKIYFIVENHDKEIVKYELKNVEGDIFRQLFNGLSMMIYDSGVSPIKNLEEVYILETIPKIK